MLVLLDQGVPAPLRHSLIGHSVKTAAQQGWGTLTNGELLKAAESAEFQVFITADKNLAYQQNLKERIISIIVLGNPQWPILQQHTDLVLSAVAATTIGSYTIIEIPRSS